MTILYAGILWICNRQLRKSVMLMTASIVISAVVAYGFYGVMIRHVLPWVQQQPLRELLQFHQSIPFSTYVFALGPTAFLSLLFLFPIFTRQVNRLFILILLWALIPAFIFQFADIGIMQPLKTHQYIPLALLTTAGIKYLTERSKVFLMFIPLIIGGATLYALPPYLATCRLAYEEHYENYFNYYIPDYLTNTFTYLNKHTPNRSVVLAGEAVSVMIPTFTHNYVFIGQGDIVPDYNERVMSAINFFNQNMDQKAMKTFLYSHHISYILFSVDAPTFEGNFPELPFLKKVYRDGFSSIVQVLP